jgi:hypothetical protein
MEEDDVGENVVMGWLKHHGWKKVRSIKNEIEAEKDDKRILLQVRSSIYPIDPGFLTAEEIADIKEHALKKGAMPHFARIWLNNDCTLKDDTIMWRRL